MDLSFATKPKWVPSASLYRASFIRYSLLHGSNHRVQHAPLHGQKIVNVALFDIGGGEQIAIRPMLKLVPPRVAPIVKNLAAIWRPMPLTGFASLRFQILMTTHDFINVEHLKSGMVEARIFKRLQ